MFTAVSKQTAINKPPINCRQPTASNSRNFLAALPARTCCFWCCLASKRSTASKTVHRLSLVVCCRTCWASALLLSAHTSLECNPAAGPHPAVTKQGRERDTHTNRCRYTAYCAGTPALQLLSRNTPRTASTMANEPQDVAEMGGASTPGVPRLSLTVSEHAVTDGAIEILKVIRPHWNSDRVRFKLFTDGITNKLVGCFYQRTPPESSGSAAADDVVLIRVYGNKTDLLIDRRKETENIQLLHRHGYAPALYATFTNGLAYEYVPGVTLTTDTCRHEHIWPLVARRMAQMHKVIEKTTTGVNTSAPALPAKIDQFLKLIPSRFSDAATDERVWKVFPRIDALRAEFDELYGRLCRANSPVVFCHNDLLLGNVIYDEARERVTFIDYEYAAPNHQAFDIGNHFTEFAGIEEIDYGRYPDRTFQLRWLGEYLREYSGDLVSENDVQRLYVQVNQYALASHFLWAVWALIQAEHSTIDFDFVQFGTTRFLEYRERRDEFLALCYSV